jgi:hypothetical protein
VPSAASHRSSSDARSAATPALLGATARSSEVSPPDRSAKTDALLRTYADVPGPGVSTIAFGQQHDTPIKTPNTRTTSIPLIPSLIDYNIRAICARSGRIGAGIGARIEKSFFNCTQTVP